MVYEHCKKLLESLMLLAANQDHPEAARLLLSYQTNLDDTLEMISEVKDTSPNETGIDRSLILSLNSNTGNANKTTFFICLETKSVCVLSFHIHHMLECVRAAPNFGKHTLLFLYYR